MSVIVPLNLPKAPLKLSKKGDAHYVWCVIRKKSLLLTPEEWVRQHLIHYLHHELRIPFARMAAEYSIQVNQLSRRCDIVVFDHEGKPTLIVECKAPEIALSEEVFYQIAQYNRTLNVALFMMSNGLHHVFGKINYSSDKIEFLPDFSQEKF